MIVNKNHKSISLSEQIFDHLERDILCGKYAYGEILTETKLCEDLGVSRTPIREALNRLKQENLIIESPKGVTVMGITTKDIEDIYAVRIKIEPMCIKSLIENITDDEIKILGDIIDLQEFYSLKNDAEMVRDEDSEFHEMIYKLCKSKIFYEILTPLHRKVMKFREASVSNSVRQHKSIDEHKAIFEAIKARDADTAEKLFIEHIKNAQNSILGEVR